MGRRRRRNAAQAERAGWICSRVASDRFGHAGDEGRVLYEKACELIPSLRVIYMSGYARNIISNHGILNEELTFLQKPFTVPVLLDKVTEVLRNGKGEEGGVKKKLKPKL